LLPPAWCFLSLLCCGSGGYSGSLYFCNCFWIALLVFLPGRSGQRRLVFLPGQSGQRRLAAWLPLIFSLIVLSVMYIWHYVTLQKQPFESYNRTSLDMLLSLGTNIGINCVRGVGLVYTNVLSEIPPMFSHFVTNFPAFHHVLIIVTFQCLTIPRVFC